MHIIGRLCLFVIYLYLYISLSFFRSFLPSLKVQHPAARMIVMASHMQEQEVGDGTNFVLVFAGALLELAEELLRMGLSVSEVSKQPR